MLLAGLFGCLFLLTIFLLLIAVTKGSIGGSTLLCNIGMFLSAIFGVVVFHDDFTIFIGIGMALMLVSVILQAPHGKGKNKLSRSWFIFALASGLSNGCLASVKSTAVRTGGDFNMKTFLMYGFAVSAIIFALIFAIRKPLRDSVRELFKKHAAGVLICGISTGASTGLANMFQLLALSAMSSAIVYPLTAGFLVVFMYLLSLLWYKETKLTVSGVLSVLFCVAAIIFMNLK